MDYLIFHWDWALGIFLFLMLAVAVDELWFRMERRRIARANLIRVMEREKLPDYIDEDELSVISNDTDEVVFQGTPPEVYGFLMVNLRYGSYDIYNRGTAKKNTSAYFLSKYIPAEERQT